MLSYTEMMIISDVTSDEKEKIIFIGLNPEKSIPALPVPPQWVFYVK